jgi:hypothetical protein
MDKKSLVASCLTFLFKLVLGYIACLAAAILGNSLLAAGNGGFWLALSFAGGLSLLVLLVFAALAFGPAAVFLFLSLKSLQRFGPLLIGALLFFADQFIPSIFSQNRRLAEIEKFNAATTAPITHQRESAVYLRFTNHDQHKREQIVFALLRTGSGPIFVYDRGGNFRDDPVDLEKFDGLMRLPMEKCLAKDAQQWDSQTRWFIDQFGPEFCIVEVKPSPKDDEMFLTFESGDWLNNPNLITATAHQKSAAGTMPIFSRKYGRLDEPHRGSVFSMFFKPQTSVVPGEMDDLAFLQLIFAQSAEVIRRVRNNDHYVWDSKERLDFALKLLSHEGEEQRRIGRSLFGNSNLAPTELESVFEALISISRLDLNNIAVVDALSYIAFKGAKSEQLVAHTLTLVEKSVEDFNSEKNAPWETAGLFQRVAPSIEKGQLQRLQSSAVSKMKYILPLMKEGKNGERDGPYRLIGAFGYYFSIAQVASTNVGEKSEFKAIIQQLRTDFPTQIGFVLHEDPKIFNVLD